MHFTFPGSLYYLFYFIILLHLFCQWFITSKWEQHRSEMLKFFVASTICWLDTNEFRNKWYIWKSAKTEEAIRLCEKSFYQSFSHGRITRFLWAHISESSCLKTKISPSGLVRAYICSWGQKGTLKYWFLWDLENEIIKTNWLYVFLLVLQLLSFIIKDYD